MQRLAKTHCIHWARDLWHQRQNDQQPLFRPPYYSNIKQRHEMKTMIDERNLVRTNICRNNTGKAEAMVYNRIGQKLWSC